MNIDSLKGTANEALGQVKQAAGRYSGDARTQAEGYYDQASGIAQRNYGQARDVVTDVAQNGTAALVRQVEDQPIASLLVAAAVGFVVGWAVRR